MLRLGNLVIPNEERIVWIRFHDGDCAFFSLHLDSGETITINESEHAEYEALIAYVNRDVCID